VTKPFSVAVPDEVLDDLRARVRATRWPPPAPGAAWSQGTDLAYLQDLLAYWADGFDWRAAERGLNAVPVHFVHVRPTVTWQTCGTS